MPPEAKHTIKLSSATDLLSVVPYLLGFHPSLSMVIVIIDTKKAMVDGLMRYNLPEESADATGLADHLTTILLRNKVPEVVLVGYGPGNRVSPVVDAATEALNRAGIRRMDVLRVDQGRYWSYLCMDSECCPPEGVSLDIASGVSAAAVFAGLVAQPDRATLAASLKTIDDIDSEQVKAATQAMCGQTRSLLDPHHDWYHEGVNRISAALDRVKEGGKLKPEEVAALGVRLTALPVRDAALTFFSDHDDDTHLQLWLDVVRRVPPSFAPAPAALLGFAALRRGKGTLAQLAAEHALAIDPDYRFADMIRMAASHALDPSVIAGSIFANVTKEIEAEVQQSPAQARPKLPEGW